jgi:hypothetical protein
MSLDEKKLRNDFDAYLRGEDPPGVVLATAPRLDDWAVVVNKSPGDGTWRMTLVGNVRGHPKQPDGRKIQTSPVVWMDRMGRWARTVSRVYALEGQQIQIEGVPL